jgi:hypothetical protein
MDPRIRIRIHPKTSWIRNTVRKYYRSIVIGLTQVTGIPLFDISIPLLAVEFLHSSRTTEGDCYPVSDWRRVRKRDLSDFSTLLHLPPADSAVAGFERKTVSTMALVVRRSNYSARFYSLWRKIIDLSVISEIIPPPPPSQFAIEREKVTMWRIML